jgi:hypothetical protein
MKAKAQKQSNWDKLLKRILWRREVARLQIQLNHADDRIWKMQRTIDKLECYQEDYYWARNSLADCRNFSSNKSEIIDGLRKRISILAREKEQLLKPKLPI